MVKFIQRIWPVLKNKYVLAIVFFIVWVLFFDQNNLIDRVMSIHNLRQMESTKQYYQEKIKIDSKKLNELHTDRENLEKFAREQYLMKKENEDIFIMVDE
jgi:cell division protein DivIC